MKQQRARFALRTHSRFPLRTSAIYVGQDVVGQGIVRELSRVGCRILGNYPVTPGETLSLRIAHPTGPDPLFIEQATVQWVNGLEFGVAFGSLDEEETDRLNHLLGDLLSRGSSSGRLSPSREQGSCLDGDVEASSRLPEAAGPSAAEGLMGLKSGE